VLVDHRERLEHLLKKIERALALLPAREEEGVSDG
jgi:hypothetical protein